MSAERSNENAADESHRAASSAALPPIVPQVEFVYTNEDQERVKEITGIAVRYLCQLKSAGEVLTDQRGYEAFNFCLKAVGFSRAELYMFAFGAAKFERFMGDLLAHLYTLAHEIDFEAAASLELWSGQKCTSPNERRVVCMAGTLYIVNISALNSVTFSINFAAHAGLEAHFAFLADDEFVRKRLDTHINMFTKKIALVEYLAMNVSSLSKLCDENRTKWTDVRAVEILLQVRTRKPSTNMDACIAVMNIATDKELERMTEIHSILSLISTQVAQCGVDFESGKLNRQNRQIIESDTARNCLVHCVTQANKTTTSILVLLQGLYKLAVNEKMRLDVFESNVVALRIIVAKGNPVEVRYVLRLLAQLSFSRQIAQRIDNDIELRSTLMSILSQNSSSETQGGSALDLSLRKLCQQIEFNVNESKKQQERSSTSDVVAANRHVMISYNTASRETCLSIKQQLEASGVRVWIDVDDIHGSSLDSMAQAVENASCVLVCVTEKYRQSLNCQSEAQYAFRLNKRIIPLIMQAGYESVKGWLGIVLGDKIFVNFAKYPFDECMRRLKNEINMHTAVKALQEISLSGSSSSAVAAVMKSEVPVDSARCANIPSGRDLLTPSTKSRSTKSPVLQWSEDQVSEWLKGNDIDDSVLSHLKPCSGIILFQLFKMKSQAPEFYYQTLHQNAASLNSGKSLKRVLLFTYRLDQLFAEYD